MKGNLLAMAGNGEAETNEREWEEQQPAQRKGKKVTRSARSA